MNNRDVSAAYPPVSQWLHAAVTWLAGGPELASRSIFGMRLCYAIADLLCLIPLASLLRGQRFSNASLLAWAWSPLIAIEFAGSAHFDSFGILMLLSALALLSSEASRHVFTRIGALSLLVAGALTKLIPGLLVPFVGVGPGRLAYALAGAMLFALAWWPFLGSEARDTLAGLTEYGTRWEAGSLLFRHLEAPLNLWFERDETWTDPRRLARGAIGLLFLAVYLREWFRAPDILRTAMLLIGSFLVLSPTLHPWYLAWFVPFLVLQPSRAWLWLVAAAPLLYWPLEGWQAEGVWQEPDWLWPVLALPFFSMLIFDALRGRQSEGERAA